MNEWMSGWIHTHCIDNEWMNGFDEPNEWFDELTNQMYTIPLW